MAGKYAPRRAIEVTTGKPWRSVSPGAALTLALALCPPSIALALDPGKNIDQYGRSSVEIGFFMVRVSFPTFFLGV